MARKNLLVGLTEPKLTAVNSAPEPPTAAKAPPLAFAGRGAFGAVARSIDEMAARADAAKELEARLTAGELIVDLDTALVDSSFVADRMSHDDEQYRLLLDGMRARGQDSPILARPHPSSGGRYQVAFGHRRLQAARELGRPVRAVVKHLSDRDLLLAQGQENSARANLSFIERARFAKRIEDANYDRETIMLAMSADKTTVSRMISVASRVPDSVIDAIGPAPGVGRDRWIEFASLCEPAERAGEAPALFASGAFIDAASEQRFEMAFDAFTRMAGKPSAPARNRPRARGQVRYWSSTDGAKVAKITANERAFVLAIDRRIAPDFGDFLLGQMDQLYAAHAKARTRK